MASQQDSAPVVEGHRDGDVLILTLNRPQVLNAIDSATAAALSAALDDAERDGCAAMVLTGVGRAFCVGTDLREPLGDLVQLDHKVAAMHRLIERLVSFPVVTVAAINGLALGGGFELALACTFRVAHPGARLGLPEIKLSLMPSYGGTQLLPRLIGPARALEMMLTGEDRNAGEALATGLVNEVAEDPLAAAISLARRVGAHAGPAQKLIRQAVEDGARHDLHQGLALERGLVAQLCRDPAVLEKLAEFVNGARLG